MGMSWAYGPFDEAENLRVLDRALELGVNHWDTADVYGSGANEELLAKALKGRREKVFLATKFGNVFDKTLTSHQDEVDKPWLVDGTPEYVRKCCDRSLQRLRIEQIDLYYQHRVDPRVPIEETVGAMAELVREGKVRFLGLSEASAKSIRKAVSVHKISVLQTEYSLWERSVEEEILPTCRELGISFVAYSPLGRGALTGTIKNKEDLAESDARRVHPRFSEENLPRNLERIQIIERVAERHRAAPAQIALAWVLAQGQDIFPIPGTKRLQYLEQNAGATDLELSAQDLAELNDVGDAIGERYTPVGMSLVNG
jgi:aryl-alcohol dehydrogenase-like predicted oxidoreductase